MIEIRRFIEVSLLLIVLLAVFPRKAQAETVYFDFSRDFQAYRETVAFLSQELPSFQSRSDGAHEEIYLSALLCKTERAGLDFSAVDPLYVISGPRNCHTLYFISEEACSNAAARLCGAPGIVYAEVDCEVYASETEADAAENDEASFLSRGAERMNFGPYLAYADTWGQGSTTIAVVDSGVASHPFLQGKLIYGGYDYVDLDEDPTDEFGHGTNVAGIIADCTSSLPVSIYPIRVLNASGGGKMGNVINGVREASNKGIPVINLSLESSLMSEALDDAILEAVSSGIVVVVAAGNHSTSTANVCPAHLTNAGVIVVGAADSSGNRASYSNYGASVDAYAFGSGIWCCSLNNEYKSATGTSMATPHISALCAMLQIIHPGLSPSEIEYRIKQAGEPGGALLIPDLLQMVPQSEGFALSSFRMQLGTELPVPTMAAPKSSCETITYCSSDEQVIAYSGGVLRAVEPGTATVTASCMGFPEQQFQITVIDSTPNQLALPAALETIEEEAFLGNASISDILIPDAVHYIGNRAFDDCPSLLFLRIPPSVTEIGENTFSNAVLLCGENSSIHHYAIESGLQYVISMDE